MKQNTLSPVFSYMDLLLNFCYMCDNCDRYSNFARQRYNLPENSYAGMR
jgi:hypothetical protein